MRRKRRYSAMSGRRVYIPCRKNGGNVASSEEAQRSRGEIVSEMRRGAGHVDARTYNRKRQAEAEAEPLTCCAPGCGVLFWEVG
eukprot:833555-Pyramimonas_sp.AAC.1